MDEYLEKPVILDLDCPPGGESSQSLQSCDTGSELSMDIVMVTSS